MLATLFAVGAVVTSLVAGWRILRNPRTFLRQFKTADDLGRLEGSLPNLVRVVVVAHQIEAPKDSLREAVKKNISRGVHYQFLVSASRAVAERKAGFNLFLTLAQMTIDQEKKQFHAPDVVKLQALPYEWEDKPYVFYESSVPDRPRVLEILALQGNQRNEGIAEGYLDVEPAHARTIHRTVVMATMSSDTAPAAIDSISYGSEENEHKIVDFATGLRSGSQR